MQQTTICTSCGAEMLGEARFCRRCGQASTQFKPESVTEGTTRILETPESNKIFGQEFYEQHGSLAQQTSRISPQANQTVRSLTTETKPQNWLLLSTILFASLALIATVLFFTLRNRTAPVASPPVVIKPEIPPVPPQPPSLPQTGLPGSGTISHEFVYPGAEILTEVSSGNEGHVLQLRTSDAPDKVVEWYTEKLKPMNTVRENKNGVRVILRASQMVAVINSEGSETSVLLHQGGDQ